jgi:hypothetical protein
LNLLTSKFDFFGISPKSKVLGSEGRIGEMLGSVPGSLDMIETMVQAVQLQQQSLC